MGLLRRLGATAVWGERTVVPRQRRGEVERPRAHPEKARVLKHAHDQRDGQPLSDPTSVPSLWLRE